MATVVRFIFPGAVSARIDVFVPGAGLFRSGTLDVSAADTGAVAAVRAVVAPLGATEVGTVDTAIVPPPASGTNDPYPQYATLTELAAWTGDSNNQFGTALRVAFVSNVVATGVAATDTARINAALAAPAAGAYKTVRLVGDFIINAPLMVPSKTTLEATNATITLAANSNCNMLRNVNYSPGAASRDSDIAIIGGRWDRGANGGSAALDRHSLFLRRIDNLRVEKLIYTSTTGGKFGIALADVNRFTVRDIASPGTGSDTVHVNGPATDGVIERIYNSGGGDDIVALTTTDYPDYDDVHGSISNIHIRNISGSSATRLVLVSGSASGVADGFGLSRITIEDVRQLGTGALVTVAGPQETASAVEDITIRRGRSTGVGVYLRHPLMRQVVIDDVRATASPIVVVSPESGQVAQNRVDTLLVRNCVGASGDLIQAGNAVSSLGTVVVEACRVTTGATMLYAVCSAIERLTVRDSSFTGTNHALALAGSVAVGSIVFSGVKAVAAATKHFVHVDASASVQSVTYRDCDLSAVDTTSGSGVFLMTATANAGSVTLDGGKATGLRNLLDANRSGTFTVRLHDAELVGCNRIVQVGVGTLNFYYSNIAHTGTVNQPVRIYGGGVGTIRGSGWSGYTNSALLRAAAEVVRVVAQDFPVDLSILAKNNGDAATNTNAALACGVGPAISNGTNWKNLYSAAVY